MQRSFFIALSLTFTTTVLIFLPSQASPSHKKRDYSKINQSLMQKDEDALLQADRKRDLALLNAARMGDTAKVVTLIKKGANIEVADAEGATPLMWAVGQIHPATVDALLAHGAWADAADNAGNTALMIACRSGYTDIAMSLINKSQCIGQADRQGRTALIWAAIKGQTKLTEAILTTDKSAFSYIDTQDHDGKTALWYATNKGYTRLAALLKKAGAESDDLIAAQTAHHDLEVTSDEFDDMNSGIYSMIGTVTNYRNKSCRYVQVSVNFFDNSGEQVDSEVANTENLAAGATWRFKVSSLNRGAISYKVVGVADHP